MLSFAWAILPVWGEDLPDANDQVTTFKAGVEQFDWARESSEGFKKSVGKAQLSFKKGAYEESERILKVTLTAYAKTSDARTADWAMVNYDLSKVLELEKKPSESLQYQAKAVASFSTICGQSIMYSAEIRKRQPTVQYADIKNYVINTAQDGRLATSQFSTTPADIDALVSQIERVQSEWIKTGQCSKRRILLYAHGGLIPEAQGFEIARKQLRFWLANHIYPINFVWRSGLEDYISYTYGAAAGDAYRSIIPFTTRSDSVFVPSWGESFAELMASRICSGPWERMKKDAFLASNRLPLLKHMPDWSHIADIPKDMPGGSLFVNRLAMYFAKHRNEVEIHLVGHSAGSIFAAGLLQCLMKEKMPVSSVTLWAPAIRFYDFDYWYVKAGTLDPTNVKRLNVFNLCDDLERNHDKCSMGGWFRYDHSLLYLLSRGIESASMEDAEHDVALVGLQKFSGIPSNQFERKTVGELISAQGELVVSDRSHSAGKCRSETHGGFDDDPDTLDYTLMLITKEPRHALVSFHQLRGH